MQHATGRWVPASCQIGQTGKKVAPELYIAVGISGASQHLVGIGNAKHIVAINTDQNASIFRTAEIGIVEDYKKLIPSLIRAVQKRKAIDSKPSAPTRQVFFNITHVWVMYAIFVVAMSIFARGWYGLWRLWSMGHSSARTRPVGARFALALRQVLTQQTLLKRYRAAGIFHALFFWGFGILFLATTVVFIHQDLGIHIMQGWFYLVFQSLIVNIFGALSILGILMALGHRYFYNAKRLKPDTPADALILAIILVILVTGFVIQGLRIDLTQDPWAAWSPVGRAVGELLAGWMSVSTMLLLHRYLWWFHAAVVFGFIAWIPYSKLRHLFTSPVNIYLQNSGPKGRAASARY